MTSLAESGDRQMAQLSDVEVARRVLAGEPALFELIMRRYNRRLFRIARGILGDTAEAEDAVQEAYVSAYFKLAQFRGPDGFATWLCRTAVNAALMQRRSRARAQPSAAVDLDAIASEQSAMTAGRGLTVDPAAALHEQQMHGLLERGIDALPETYRAVFVMREVEQMSVADTAACLGLAAATVKTRTHRARRLLQRELAGELAAALTATFEFDGVRCDCIVARVFARIGVRGRQA
jgi:RNA polymerase sigma-70 factor, ECF subfamily